MLDALVLRGMALRTQEAFIDDVARLALHYRRSPETLKRASQGTLAQRGPATKR